MSNRLHRLNRVSGGALYGCLYSIGNFVTGLPDSATAFNVQGVQRPKRAVRATIASDIGILRYHPQAIMSFSKSRPYADSKLYTQMIGSLLRLELHDLRVGGQR